MKNNEVKNDGTGCIQWTHSSSGATATFHFGVLQNKSENMYLSRNFSVELCKFIKTPQSTTSCLKDNIYHLFITVNMLFYFSL